MKAELKYLHSPDVDLRTFVPSKPDDFCLYVQVMVGRENEEGEESYGVEICTPKWLGNYCRTTGPLFGRHYIIINRYDYDELTSAIGSFIVSIDGSSWEELDKGLSQMGHSEFEDYQEL